MEDIPAGLFILVFCVVVPVALSGGGIMWLMRRRSHREHFPAQEPTEQTVLQRFQAYVVNWVDTGQLAPEVGAQLLTLIQQEQHALRGVQAPAAPAPPVSEPARTATVAPAPPDGPAHTPQPQAAEPTTAPAEKPSPWEALLAMRTRMTVLFLGAFLVLISALILVIYNWASFPPVLQWALLAGVCGSFWVGGAWVGQREGLKQAGIGLQAVGGVLVPVVAYALSRPGLLDLEPRHAWLLASALSLPVYALATWKLRHVLFIVAGCLAGVSTTLAAANLLVDEQWFLLVAVLTFATYLPMAQWLQQQGHPLLARGPRFVAHSGVSLALVLTLVLAVLGLGEPGFPDGAVAAAFWAGAGFYALATWLEGTRRWLWATAAAAPLALVTTLADLDVGMHWWALALAVLALLYFGLSAVYEPRHQAYTLPGYIGAALLGIIALLLLPNLWLDGNEDVVRWTLPVMLVGSGAMTLAYHRARFSWLSKPARLRIAVAGLLLAGSLLPLWVVTLLHLTEQTAGQYGLVLLPLAALYFVAARWFPGQMRPPYDPTLQVLGVLLALVAGVLSLVEPDTRMLGMLMLTGVWLLQTLLRREYVWAALALGNALLAHGLVLDHFGLLENLEDISVWQQSALLFTIAYMLGGTLLRHTGWRCWTLPGIVWGSGTALLTVGLVLLGVLIEGEVLVHHVLSIGVLAGLHVLLTWLWQKPWIGYPAAVLVALGVLLAFVEGFFTPWQPSSFAYALCGLTTGFFVVGQAMRRRYTAYAVPYEITGYALLTLAPLAASGSPAHETLTWSAMTLLYALATWRYRLAWVLTPTLLAADMALLSGAGWMYPGGVPSDAAPILLVAAWIQGIIGLGTHWHEHAPNERRLWQRHVAAAYMAALLSGAGAVVLALGDSTMLSTVLLGLAPLLALVATLEGDERVAWGALLVLAAGTTSLFDTLALPRLWSMTWGVAATLALCILGWGLDNLTRSATWRRPLLHMPLAAGSILSMVLLVMAPLYDNLPPLTVALALHTLLLVTLAVRQRQIAYAYVAGATLVGAVLCQFSDWGLRQPQWYVVPSGLYLLALAEGLRRFQQQRQVSQMIEAGAVVLMLGTTLGQSLRTLGFTSMQYAVLLCAESLLVLGYGTLLKLRVPFLGGSAFFVAGVLWLSVDPLASANKWILLGAVGLVLVGIYVLLEQRHEQLARTGRAWIEQMRQWN